MYLKFANRWKAALSKLTASGNFVYLKLASLLKREFEKLTSVENLVYLKSIVRKIYGVLRATEHFLHSHYPVIRPGLPEDIYFIHTEELEKGFPNLCPIEREDAICRVLGAVFLLGIGFPLKNGKSHDGRAPDYDDWTTPTKEGPGLNGDIIVWYPELEKAFEISSMGIRVDQQALKN